MSSATRFLNLQFLRQLNSFNNLSCLDLYDLSSECLHVSIMKKSGYVKSYVFCYNGNDQMRELVKLKTVSLEF